MEDQVVTNTPAAEPTIVESTATDTNVATNVEAPAVVDQATPMDANVTYNNLPKVEYQPTMDITQNVVNAYVQTENTKNQTSNAGVAMDKFLTQDYDYDKNEAGTYWVAGAINDNKTQMSFLETLINEEMYDEMDLQKYYYDTNLATARAYAAQKKKEVAYGFYRAAQERAFAEGELTGWYMPAEGRYMLGQYTVAQNTLENPDATEEDKAKATRVVTAAEKWFSANQLTTRGIKCLAMMNYEENVRHNKIMGELQKEANAIAASGAAASAKAAEIAELQFRFKVEEQEMDMGYDFSYEIGLDNEKYIGHNPKDYKEYQGLKGYSSVKDMLMYDPVHYAQVLQFSSEQHIRDLLGEDYSKATYNYEGYKGNAILEKSVQENNGNVLSESGLTPQGKFSADTKPKDLDPNDNNIYRFYSTNPETGKPELRLYYKNKYGSYKQLTKTDYELENGKSLDTIIDKDYFVNTELTYNGEQVKVGPITDMSEFKGSYSTKTNPRLTGKQAKTVAEKQQEGWQVVDGTMSVDNINASIVMKKYNSETKKWEYAEVSNVKGDFKKVTQLYDIRHVNITNEAGDKVGTIDPDDNNISWDGISITETDLNGKKYTVIHSDRYDAIEPKLFSIESNDGYRMWAYQQHDGTVVYLKEYPNTATRNEINHNNYADKSSTLNQVVVITEEQAQQYGADTETFKANRKEYNNGVKTTKAISKDDVAKEITKQDTKDDTEISKQSSGTASAPTKTGDKVDYKGEVTQTSYEKREKVTMDDRPVVLDDLQKDEKNKNKGINDVEFI